jgi:hypothetical protein
MKEIDINKIKGLAGRLQDIIEGRLDKLEKRKEKQKVKQKELILTIAKRFFLRQVESRVIIKFIFTEITKNLRREHTFVALAPS